MLSREKRFCEEYVIDYDAGKAARRAGYGKRQKDENAAGKQAEKAGKNLLKRKDILDEVARLQEEYNRERCFSEKERVLKELWDTYEKATGVEEQRRWDSEGRPYWPVREYKYDGKAALKALELIAKMNGMLKENVRTELSTGDKTEVEIRVVKGE